ncbi:hypothetical protein YC2023_116594 [Brassica napus]
MFPTQLRSSLKKNQIKRSSYVIVMLFTNQVIFSSREFRPPEKLEIANLLSDEPTGVDKALKDVSKSQKKSTPTRAPVAEPSIFISGKPKGKSENNLENLKDFSDSLPIFDKYDEELMEIWITCEDECDLPSPKPDLMFDIDNEETNGLTCFEPEHPSSLVLVSQVFEEEPLNYQHQGPRLETRRPLDNDLSPIFDEEDELDPIFDEEAPSTSSIIIEKHLCFDPGTTSTPLPKKHSIVDDRFEVGRWTEVRSSLGSCKHKLRTPDVVGQKRFLLGIDLKNASTTTRLMTASSNKTPDMDSQSILPAATVGYTVHVPRRAEEVDEAMPSFENEEKRHIVT